MDAGVPGSREGTEEKNRRMTNYTLTVNADRAPSFKMSLDRGFESERFVLDSMQHGQCYEGEVCVILAKALREGDCAYDVGANIGYFTLMMAALVGPSGRVKAFEPGENNIPRLRGNIALNQFDNIEVIEKPVWSHVTDLTFWLNHDNSGGNGCWDPGKWSANVKSRAAPSSRIVQSTTLDRVFIKVPRVIKLDVEGAEYHVMVGAHGLLKHKPPFIIAEWNQFAFSQLETSGEELRSLLKQHSYDMFLIDASGAKPLRLKPTEALTLPENVIINVLFSTQEAVDEIWEKSDAQT